MKKGWEKLHSLIIKPFANSLGVLIPSSSIAVKWNTADQDNIKFNCHGRNLGAFGAVVLRNHRGALVNGKKFKVMGQSVLVRKAMLLEKLVSWSDIYILYPNISSKEVAACQ